MALDVSHAELTVILRDAGLRNGQGIVEGGMQQRSGSDEWQKLNEFLQAKDNKTMKRTEA